MRNLIIVLIVFVASCGYQENVPENIIPKEKMIEILVDIHLADGMFTNNNVRTIYATKDSANYYELIFQHHGFTREDFDTSVYYYSHNINEYNKIYIEVLNKLSERETGVKGELQEAPIEQE